MATFIELHIITYFSMLLFLHLALKMFFKTKAHVFSMVITCLMFAIIKFLLDFYRVSIVWQFAILAVYIIVTTIAVHNLNHISKLIASVFVFLIYYLCLVGINWVITTVVLKQNIYYISNFYLFTILGLNFIIFSLFCIITIYLRGQNLPALTRNCEILIANTKIELTGFIDTGNCLKDYKSNKSILIINLDSIRKYITDKMYADLLLATNCSGEFKDIHKLTYKTIAGTNSITVFNPQRFMVENRIIDCYVGITTTTMLYDVLLNAECI